MIAQSDVEIEGVPMNRNRYIFLFAPFQFAIRDWREQPAATGECLQAMVGREPAILQAAGAITEADRDPSIEREIENLRGAAQAQDPRAIGALHALQDLLERTCDVLIANCLELRADRAWAEIMANTKTMVILASGSGRHDQLAKSWSLQAQAARAAGARDGAKAAYARAIEEGAAARDHDLVSAARDNLGNLLLEEKRPDEALEHYREARKIEERKRVRNPEVLATLLNNEATALDALGEYSAAARSRERVVQLREGADLDPASLAVALDNHAGHLARSGDLDGAAALRERARVLFPTDDLPARARNAHLRASLSGRRGDTALSATAFQEALELAAEHARKTVDAEEYRRCFEESLASRLPFDDEVWKRAYRAHFELQRGNGRTALEDFSKGAERAAGQGDFALALRLYLEQARVLINIGDLGTALKIAAWVRNEASRRSLARPELLAISLEAKLARDGADVEIDELNDYMRKKRLLEVHRDAVNACDLSEEAKSSELHDDGTTSSQIGNMAADCRAYGIAAHYYKAAVASARDLKKQERWRFASRLAGLRLALSKLGRSVEAEAVASEIASLAEEPNLSARGRAMARCALADNIESKDRKRAVLHLREACRAAEALRAEAGSGPHRSGADREFRTLHGRLAGLLRREGDVRQAFEALQRGKGRALLDAAFDGGRFGTDQPPDLAEVGALLRGGPGKAEVLVDFAVEASGLTAYVVDAEARLRVVHAEGNVEDIAEPDRGDVRDRQIALMAMCRNNDMLLTLVARVSDGLAPGTRVNIVPDDGLHNLPLHVVPIDGRPWCEHFPIGYLPTVGSLRLRGRLAAGVPSLVAGDSAGDLPEAARECKQVASALDVEALVGSRCTQEAVRAALASDELAVVHLAVHGRGDPRLGGRASLLLVGEGSGHEWVDLEAMFAGGLRAALVVLSGCSTGTAGLRHGHRLVSVASRALEAGAAAVVACLWPVEDKAAADLMIAFHAAITQARRAGVAVDLRVCLDEARASLRAISETRNGSAGVRTKRREGRHLSLEPETEENAQTPQTPELPEVTAAMDWAPFVVVGSPVLEV